MRNFLFRVLFKLTWWVAPNKPRVNRIFSLYLEYIEAEENYVKCQKRQAYLDKSIRPRTPPYEHLTCRKQREQYKSLMPWRAVDKGDRSHYSDYDEAKAYHESK